MSLHALALLALAARAQDLGSLAVLEATLRSHPNPDAREDAFAAICTGYGVAEAASIFTWQMQNGPAKLRAAAIRCWSRGGGDLATLVAMLGDGEPSVRMAAVEAIGPRASSPEDRDAVLHALGEHLSRETEPRIRQEIETCLASWTPGLALDDSEASAPPLVTTTAPVPPPVAPASTAPRPPAVSPVPVGRPPRERRPEADEGAMYALATAYGGYVGGNVGYLVDEAAESTEQPVDVAAVAVGSLLGGGAGMATAALLGHDRQPSAAESVALGSGVFVGGFVGTNLGLAFIPQGADGRAERVQAAQFAGTLAGGGLALIRNRPVESVGPSLHVDVATVAGWQTAAGVSDMAGLSLYEDGQLRSGLALAGGLGFAGTAALVGRQLDAPTPATLGLAAADGLWLGAWSPFLFTDEPTPQQIGGGLRLGLGAGYVATMAIAGSGYQPSGRSIALQGIGAAAGTALGAGIPLSLGEEGPARAVVGPMLATGLAGQLAGAAVAPYYSLSEDDLYLVGALGAWTGYQSVGWATFSHQAGAAGSTRPLGHALTAGGAGTLITMASAPLLEVPPSSTFQLIASGGWGSWFAGWGAQLADLERDEQWLVTLAGGDVAIVGTAVAEAAGLRPTWSDVGIVNGAGALGAAAGGLLGVIVLYEEDNWDPLVVSTLAGSGLGLVGGTVLAARTGGGSSDLALPTIDALDAKPSVAVRPWADEERKPGVYVELRLDEVR